MSLIRTPSTNDERAALARRCYELRIAGKNVTEIADALNITEEMADGYASSWLETRPAQEVPVARKLQADRIEKLYDELHTSYRAGTLPVEKYVDAFVKLANREARLLGLDAPVRTESTVTVQDTTDAALMQMVTEAKAKHAAEMAELEAERQSIYAEGDEHE